MNRLLILAAFGALIVAAAPTARADTIDDMAFLQVIDEQGIGYTSATAVIAAGHEVCADLAQGYSVGDVIRHIFIVTPLSLDNAAFFTGAATGAYCPRFAHTAQQML